MSKPISKAKLLWGFGLFLVGWAVVGGMIMIKTANDFTARSYARVEIQQISTAFTKLTAAGSAIPDAENSSLFRALAGSNSSQTAFFISRHTNVMGEVLDYWGTPYRIEKSGATNFTVSSAGKNKSFGDDDDVLLDSAAK
ncbi:MAG: hypothetical protein JWM68_2427 [Verrucomicrobiales bacterium]|nr:hypothetical protein [Verrucomicrobiales bacterium]